MHAMLVSIQSPTVAGFAACAIEKEYLDYFLKLIFENNFADKRLAI